MDLMTEDTYTDLVTEDVDVVFRLGELTDSALMAKRMLVAYRGICAAPSYIKKSGPLPALKA